LNKIIIYSSLENNKLNYILSFIFSEILDLSYSLNPTVSPDGTAMILRYGVDGDNGLTVEESGYLKGNNIFDYDAILPEEIEFNEQGLSFDLFAAVFYLLGRVEEYRSDDLDSHGRFQSKNSLLQKQGLLEIPIIDKWISQLKMALEKHYRIDIAYNRSYTFESTIDIDQFFAFKHKSFFVQAGSFTRDVLRMNFNRIKERFQGADPYDTFNYLESMHNDLGIKLIYFVLCAERTQFDKNISFNNPVFKQKLDELSAFEIGIHPSYYSGSFAGRLKEEKERLESISNRKIVKSRQHYLKLTLPQTYIDLINSGITEDYSMGYPERVGFRAGTSYPFKWYNLNEDEVTNLSIYPFCAMDVTLKDYLQLDGTEALKLCKKMIDEIKLYNGYCSLIWHNSSFFELESWKAWDEVYQHLLSYAKV